MIRFYLFVIQGFFYIWCSLCIYISNFLPILIVCQRVNPIANFISIVFKKMCDLPFIMILVYLYCHVINDNSHSILSIFFLITTQAVTLSKHKDYIDVFEPCHLINGKNAVWQLKHAKSGTHLLTSKLDFGDWLYLK